ncbi:MAG: riboflavin synthase [Candidatus Poribacteria bacterium]|nr:riboflavin synthase [Candidatus Poribacteria bacterium]
MFTGIVEEIGTITEVYPQSSGVTVKITAETVLEDAKIGDSIAVDGPCLTVRDLEQRVFVVDISEETRRRTTLRSCKVGTRVNLERSLRLGDRIGGHLVLGHVDEIATISGWKNEGTSSIMQVTVSPKIKPYIAYKGSIAVDGVSLTIADVSDNKFEVALIPHTLQVTTLGDKRNGDSVNIEVDVMARYIETLMQNQIPPSQTIDLEFLQKHGYG